MAEDQVQITPATKTFDLATVLGLLGAFSLIGQLYIWEALRDHLLICNLS